ncbi:MAG: hypothetical protein IKT46_07895 [Clostridia bacterium]|nr:hypothetical protein [Clostridia bacterium]
MKKTMKALSIIAIVAALSVIMVFAVMADEGDTVYISISDDSYFVTDINNNPVAYTGIKIDDLKSIDLCDYGLDQYRYDSDWDGEYDITALHLYIYIHENLMGLDWSDVTVTGGVGSIYFESSMFGFEDENLRYDLNGAYPNVDGWGVTADQIVLHDGDFLNIAHYTDWAFWGDSLTGFHYFTDTDGKLIREVSVTEGESLTLGLVRSFSDWSNGGEAAFESEYYYNVYYGRSYGNAEGELCTDDNGYIEFTLPEEGMWYVWADGGYGEYYPEAVVSAPAFAYINVEAAAIPVPEPEITAIDNYTLTMANMNDVKEVRFAIGRYTTGTQIKNAEKNLTLSASVVNSNTVDGVFTYDLPWVGEYTFWVRANDGSSYFLYTAVENIQPYVTSYGVKLTVNDFGENYKDAWLAKGTFNSYSEIKASSEFKYQASANKLANYAKTTHDFTYTMEDPGDYTVLIRYNDGTFDVIHHTLTVTTPVLVENGLQAIITNIPDIKIIRTAYGHYESVADIKNASTVRYFNNKTAIKDAEEYMIQYREEGEVTIIVEYNDGYKHYFYYNVQKKVPTYTLEGDKITFGNLDDLYIIRYAPGKYTTSNNIKNAPNSQFIKTVDENGEIVIDGLTTGRWSFMVQYNDDSYNFYVIDVK